MKFHESGAFFGPVRQINPKSPSAVPTEGVKRLTRLTIGSQVKINKLKYIII